MPTQSVLFALDDALVTVCVGMVAYGVYKVRARARRGPPAPTPVTQAPLLLQRVRRAYYVPNGCKRYCLPSPPLEFDLIVQLGRNGRPKRAKMWWMGQWHRIAKGAPHPHRVGIELCFKVNGRVAWVNAVTAARYLDEGVAF